jgi:hypothetical protein
MSKCRPSCCPGNSSEGGAVVIIGLVVLGVAIYGIIRAILHVLIEIVEIIAIAVGSIGALILVTLIAIGIIRWQRSRRRPTGLKLIAVNPAFSPMSAPAHEPKAIGPDAAQLFAEAVANGMDPRFVERILNAAMQRSEQ